MNGEGVGSTEAEEQQLRVGIIMGSASDLGVMRNTGRALTALGLTEKVNYEERVVSAHRTPEWMEAYATTAEERGLEVVVAGAGGSSHLQGMLGSFAAKTRLHVIGVPITSNPDVMNRSLGSCIGMPEGAPLAVSGQNESGAFNAGLLAFKALATRTPELWDRYFAYLGKQERNVMEVDSRLNRWGAETFLRRESASKEAKLAANQD